MSEDQIKYEDFSMDTISDFLFEATMLKKIPRSGYQFLGSGKESVAEHVFITTLIAFVLSQIRPGIDASRLVNMCLVHDLLEARTGDLNHMQKKYVTADDETALSDTVKGLPFGKTLAALLREFAEGRTEEAVLARDADQLAFLIDLKALADMGHQNAKKWIPLVKDRVQSALGKKIAETLLTTEHDRWWLQKLLGVSDR